MPNIGTSVMVNYKIRPALLRVPLPVDALQPPGGTRDGPVPDGPVGDPADVPLHLAEREGEGGVVVECGQ